MNQVTITEETLPLIWRCFDLNSGFAVHMQRGTLCHHKGREIPHGIKMIIDAKKTLSLLGDEDSFRESYEAEIRNYFAMPSYVAGEVLLEYLTAFRKELKKLSQM